MEKNWDRAVAHVLRWEGGAAVRPNEPGGAVNMGVSLAAYREVHPGASIAELLAMTADEAKRIYREHYAAKIGFDRLPAGYDAASLHGAVMFGPGQGNSDRPGWAAFHGEASGDYGYLVVLMMRAKMHRKDGITFMPGWSDRFADVYRLAKELASS